MRDGRSEDALSEIVGFVLVLALVVVASTLYLMYVVPAEGREDEITHMNQVQDRFISYKTSVDGLWLRSLPFLSMPWTHDVSPAWYAEASASIPRTQGVSLSTSFDLGTGGGNTQSSGIFLSFMKPIGTAAKMRVDPGSGDRIAITVNGDPLFVNEALPEGNAERNFVPLGSLSYHTDNYYWIQQIYWYKMGGVFLEQPNDGVSVKVAPAISLSNPSVKLASGELKPRIKLNLCLVNPTTERQMIGGTGPLRVETRLRESANHQPPDQTVDSIKVEIRSEDGEWHAAWMQVLDGAVRNSGLDLTDPQDSWACSVTSPDGRTAVLEIPNPDPDGTVPDHDVKFDLTEAPLQVTFEYDE